MNSDTYHSSRKNSNDYNQIMLTGGFGIGYVHWFEKFGIESNISYKKKGHNYMVYVEGRLYEKKINLDYINASLQIRKCITKDETKLSKSFYLAECIMEGYCIKISYLMGCRTGT